MYQTYSSGHLTSTIIKIKVEALSSSLKLKIQTKLVFIHNDFYSSCAQMLKYCKIFSFPVALTIC